VRIFRSGLRKLLPRPATWVTLGILLGLVALIYLAVGATAKQLRSQPNGEASLLLLTFPGAYDYVFSFILSLGGLLSLIYGAAIAGSEWSWGTLKTAVARGEGRVRYMTLTFVSVTLLVGVGLVLSFVVGTVMAVIGAGLAGVPTSGISDSATIGSLPEKLLRGWLALTEQAALGFAIATVARSQLAGIGAGIGIYFGEQFATIFLPDVVKYLPFNVASAILAPTAAPGGGGGAIARLDPTTALVMVVIWLVGALAVSGAVTERADIGG
jgi:ABC-2 type transport system permease protein